MIRINHLMKRYDDVTPLIDINTEIKKGDVITIIGPSGSGKSLLLRCINMLVKPTEGQIIINGQDITDKNVNLKKMRMKVGMVFQQFNLFSHKMVIENVMMGPMDLLGLSKQEAFDKALKYLKMVGLAEILYKYPDELSGGQKQRVAIARCLAMEPDIILFDEPIASLDPINAEEVQRVINMLASKGNTMIIVTHNLNFSRDVSNRVFYLDEGVVYEEGTPEEIFDNPKRQKTRIFVRRLETLEYEIKSKDFDLYEMNAKISEFAKLNYLEYRITNALELVLEEIIVNNIIMHTDKLKIGIRYDKIENFIEVELEYGGNSYNPYGDDEEDILSMLLVRQMTTNVRYRFDKINYLSFRIERNRVKID